MENVYEISNRVRTKLDELTSKDGLRISWPKLADYIHKNIDERNLLIVGKKKHYSQWNKIHSGITDKGLSVPWWQEFESIIDCIIADLSADTATGHDIFSKLNSSRKSLDRKLNYGIFINQDSYIPKVYEATYKQGLPNLVFKTLPHWNRTLFALTENNINVTLADFSTAVAFSYQIDPKTPLFFWPFFYFTGWYLLVKKSSLDGFYKREGLSVLCFEDLTNFEKKTFFEQSKIVVEGKTDFEWVLKAFCKEFDCDISKINIVDINTNDGKKLFVENKECAVYCTNPLNVTDLLVSKKYENVLAKIDHKNVNGLLCKKEFYENNKEVVQHLIKNWFIDIKNFKREINELNKGVHFREPGYEPSFTIRNLVRELNEGINSIGKTKIYIDDLPILYEHKNHFYNTAKEAYDEFYFQMLDDETLMNNYIELTKLRLEDLSLDDKEIRKVILEIKRGMIKLAK